MPEYIPSHNLPFEVTSYNNRYDQIGNTLNFSISIYDQLRQTLNFEKRFHVTNFTDTLDELIKNIKEHSNCTEFYIIITVWIDKLIIEFWDNGDGIKKTLTRHDPKDQSTLSRGIIDKKRYLKLRKQSDSTAIKNAFRDGYSGTSLSKLNFNSGNGLYSVLENWIAPFRGTITVMSGKGAVRIEGLDIDQAKKYDIAGEIKGTYIHIFLSI